MNTDTTKTELFRRYLLDDLSDDERREMEEDLFTSDPAFDEMEAIEDELFYEYKAGELTPAEKAIFEQKFLRTAEDRGRAAFAGAFLETAAGMYPLGRETVAEERVSVWQSVAAFFNLRGAAMQFGMAAGLLLLLFGVIGLLVQNARVRNEIATARQRSDADLQERETQLAEKQHEQQLVQQQLDQEREKNDASDARIKELESQRSTLENEINAQRSKPLDRVPGPGRQSTIATLVISPGVFTRSDGVPMNRVELSPSMRSLSVTLRLKDLDDYPRFIAKVTDVDTGNEILARTGLTPKGKTAHKMLNLSVPTNSLRRADYEITLSGVTKTGEVEEITRYYFSVVK